MSITDSAVVIFAMFFGVIALGIILSHRSEMTRLRTGYYDDKENSNPVPVEDKQ